ncbi:hypothetical protein Tco_1108369 [Tanacetum coccineum]
MSILPLSDSKICHRLIDLFYCGHHSTLKSSDTSIHGINIFIINPMSSSMSCLPGGSSCRALPNPKPRRGSRLVCRGGDEILGSGDESGNNGDGGGDGGVSAEAYSMLY